MRNAVLFRVVQSRRRITAVATAIIVANIALLLRRTLLILVIGVVRQKEGVSLRQNNTKRRKNLIETTSRHHFRAMVALKKTSAVRHWPICDLLLCLQTLIPIGAIRVVTTGEDSNLSTASFSLLSWDLLKKLSDNNCFVPPLSRLSPLLFLLLPMIF